MSSDDLALDPAQMLDLRDHTIPDPAQHRPRDGDHLGGYGDGAPVERLQLSAFVAFAAEPISGRQADDTARIALPPDLDRALLREIGAHQHVSGPWSCKLPGISYLLSNAY